jgi:hypothetical protein
MKPLSDEEALELLRGAMAVDAASPSTDLWPGVRRRIDQGGGGPVGYDWVLLAALALIVLLNPSLIGILFLQF